MEIIKLNITTEVVNFWNTLKLYFEKPKSINKQVLFSEIIFNAELPSSVNFAECHILVNKFSNELSKDLSFKFDRQILECLELNILTGADVSKAFLNEKGMFLLVRRLIPKLNITENLKFFEFIFLDKYLSKAYIFTSTVPIQMCKEHFSVEGKEWDPFVILKFDFIQLTWNSTFLEISYNEHLSKKGITWLKATFFPKFTKFANHAKCEQTNKKLINLQFDNKIDLVQYYQLYKQMKLKYGKHFLGNWTESTDPLKFVYEDIAIATYLILLWNNGNISGENMKIKKFVDLGCGNGLLVHILNSEGHLGIGLDVRKRKIWDTYPPSTVLKEQTVIPSIETRYPEADWLIGNHSDELTAWIPIMARVSNDHCQYFVLPCCPYQLNGMKFQRKNAGLSSYQDFIGYLKDISEECGFITSIDRLKIPSTKRICLIGLNDPEMTKFKYDSFVQAATGFVEKENQSSSFNKGNSCNDCEGQSSMNVKLRKSVEPVKNCTKLPEDFINRALRTIMSELLKESVTFKVIKDGENCTWNRGGKLSIKELASRLDEQLMKQLKNECKGLQTLLKNQYFLFEVSQGHVQFRKPETLLDICNRILESKNKSKWKIKICWFFNNHPNGCPLDENLCSYKHEQKIQFKNKTI